MKYIVSRDEGKATWFFVGPADAWSPNRRLACRFESAEAARDWARRWSDAQVEADSNPVRQSLPPFFTAVLQVVRDVAREAAEVRGLELLPEEPVHVFYSEGQPLEHYRADWLFAYVTLGGHRGQFQVHAEAIDAASGRVVNCRVPYTNAAGNVALAPYLEAWRDGAVRRGQAWAGVHGRSGSCSCPFCREAQRQGLVEPHGNPSEFCL